MNKKVLVIYYTQSGQLQQMASNLATTWVNAGVDVDFVAVEPQPAYPFPWNMAAFLDTMPESVLGIPQTIKPITFKHSQYDLVVIGYQPWFLSPSIPATSLLHNTQFKQVIKDTPVITLIGSRNMWLNAQEKMRTLIANAGGNRVGNIALMDRHNNHISVVTILYWMLTGKKDRYLGIFPKPGVSDADISKTAEYGATILPFLQQDNWNGLQQKLVQQKAVEIKYNLMFIKSKAGRMFNIWANAIIKRKNRSFWLVLFKYYLLFALFIVAPIVLLIHNVLFRIFFLKRAKQKMEYFLR